MMNERRIMFLGRKDSAHLRNWCKLCSELGYDTLVVEPEGSRDGIRGTVDEPSTMLRTDRDSIDTEHASLIGQVIDEIKRFNPEILQACGLDPFGLLAGDVIRALAGDEAAPALVIQVRGGADLMLGTHGSKVFVDAISAVLGLCDGLLVDHESNFRLCEELGLSQSAIAQRVPAVPGGGGLDRCEVRALRAAVSKRPFPRLIWPKAYLTIGVDGLAIAEGIRLAHARGVEFELCLLFCYQVDFRQMLRRLWPPSLFDRTTILPVVSHRQAMEEIAKSHVMLAPSLLDGIPNVLLEAMALETLPIISDHGHLPERWKGRASVQFANNLNPTAIAIAIESAFDKTPQALRGATAINAACVWEHGDRRRVQAIAGGFYSSMPIRASSPVVSAAFSNHFRG